MVASLSCTFDLKSCWAPPVEKRSLPDKRHTTFTSSFEYRQGYRESGESRSEDILGYLSERGSTKSYITSPAVNITYTLNLADSSYLKVSRQGCPVCYDTVYSSGLDNNATGFSVYIVMSRSSTLSGSQRLNIARGAARLYQSQNAFRRF